MTGLYNSLNVAVCKLGLYFNVTDQEDFSECANVCFMDFFMGLLVGCISHNDTPLPASIGNMLCRPITKMIPLGASCGRRRTVINIRH